MYTEITVYNPDMNLIDNGDGTYSDVNTGNLYDSYGNAINAVPNQSPLDYQNTSVIDNSGNVDTAAGAVNTNGGGGSSALSGIDAVINGIESAFTSLYQPLVSAGVLTSPAAQAQQQQTAAALAVQQQQATTQASTSRYLVLGAVALVLILAFKK